MQRSIPERIHKVETAVADAAGVTVNEIRGRSRKKAIVTARHAVWFIAVKHYGYTAAYVGRIYDRDHTTILSGISRISDGAATKVIKGLRRVLPEAFKNMTPESIGRRIEDWNW